MRVLFLTWEFPPLIAGGLGMACYGMARALLKQGVEIDLVLPTKDEVYFPLRTLRDVDELPVVFLSPAPQKEAQLKEIELVEERFKVLGLDVSPETYLTAGFSWTTFWEGVRTFTQEKMRPPLQIVQENLRGEENMFKKVQEFTARAAKYAEKLEFDLIHAHDWLTYPAGLIIKEISQKPLIAHVHATEFDRAGGPGDERIHRIEYAGLTGSDRVVPVSRYTAEMVIQRYRVDPEMIRIVHDAHSVPPVDEADKRRLFKGPLILFLGRITIQKGPDYFLDVAREVLRRHPEAHFVMAGTGDMMRKILHKSAAYRLRHHFLFTNFLNRREVEEILDGADIMIMPSVSEPFGIAPLEAMAHGAVAIISKQSGVAEILENVYKVDFWDVDKMVDLVSRLVENPAERLAMARSGQEEVYRIQWDEAAQKLVALYEEILPRPAEAAEPDEEEPARTD